VACYERCVARDDDIAAIVELGRRTRRPLPRWLWIAAAIVGVVCAIGFVIVLVADHAPAGPAPARSEPGGRPPGTGAGTRERSGLLTGLMIGAAVGLVIGVAIGRQRSHSSRNSP
jgi:hypothetical protein